MTPYSLAILLGTFSGFFLYIGASELLPRVQTQAPAASTMMATISGLGFIYVAVSLATAS